jgi:hypothetical protein
MGEFVFFMVIVGIIAFVVWAIYDLTHYADVCIASAKVVSLEQAAWTQTIVHHLYKLDNGQRWEDSQLHQDGETVCLATERRRK